MRKATILLLAIALAVGTGFAKGRSSGSGPEGIDELTKQKGLFKTTLVNPDADFSKYSKLYLRNVRLGFRSGNSGQSEAVAGSMVRKKSGGEVPDGEDMARIAAIINDALAIELGQSDGFEVVESPGPNTLVLTAQVTDIVCRNTKKPEDPTEMPKPLSAQGTIIFNLIDAETGVIQASVSERRKSRHDKDADPAGDVDLRWVDVSVWAEDAASDLRAELERVQSEGAEG